MSSRGSRDGDGGRLFQKFRAAAPDTVDDAELRDIIKKNNSNEEAIERVIDDLWQNQKGSSEWASVGKVKKSTSNEEKTTRNGGPGRGGARTSGSSRATSAGRGSGPGGPRQNAPASRTAAPARQAAAPAPAPSPASSAASGAATAQTSNEASAPAPAPSPAPTSAGAPAWGPKGREKPRAQVQEQQQQSAEPARTAASTAPAPAPAAAPAAPARAWGGQESMAERLKRQEAEKKKPPPAPTPAPAPAPESASAAPEDTTHRGKGRRRPKTSTQGAAEGAAAGAAAGAPAASTGGAGGAETEAIAEQLAMASIGDSSQASLTSTSTVTTEPVVSAPMSPPRPAGLQAQDGAGSPKTRLKMGKWEAPVDDGMSIAFGSFNTFASEDASASSASAWGKTEQDVGQASTGISGNGSSWTSNGQSVSSDVFPSQNKPSEAGGLQGQGQGQGQGSSSRFDQKPTHGPPGLEQHGPSGGMKPRTAAGPARGSKHEASQQPHHQQPHAQQPVHQYQQQYSQPPGIPPLSRGGIPPVTPTMPYGYPGTGFDVYSAAMYAPPAPAPGGAAGVAGTAPVPTAAGSAQQQPQPSQQPQPQQQQQQQQYTQPPGMSPQFYPPYYPYYHQGFYGQTPSYYGRAGPYQPPRYGSDHYGNPSGAMYSADMYQGGQFGDASGYGGMPMQHPGMPQQGAGGAGAAQGKNKSGSSGPQQQGSAPDHSQGHHSVGSGYYPPYGGGQPGGQWSGYPQQSGSQWGAQMMQYPASSPFGGAGQPSQGNSQPSQQQPQQHQGQHHAQGQGGRDGGPRGGAYGHYGSRGTASSSGGSW